MKCRNGYTLKQLLEVYNKKAEIPEVLHGEKLLIWGPLAEAYKHEDSWIDDAVETYLESEQFLQDLQCADESWKNRLDCNDYWLSLICDKDRKIRFIVDMDMKMF